MIQMERLVLEVVLSVVGDEAERLSLESDFDTLDVDQLIMTQIVLALESRLGVELPTNLEEAKTVAELVAGTQEALANRPNPSIVKKTVWARWNGKEWVGTRWSGEVVASNKYQEELIRTLRALASEPSNNILAIAPVSDPLSRKPKSNRPKMPPRPK
jgi:acyl carrier protein